MIVPRSSSTARVSPRLPAPTATVMPGRTASASVRGDRVVRRRLGVVDRIGPGDVDRHLVQCRHLQRGVERQGDTGAELVERHRRRTLLRRVVGGPVVDGARATSGR